MTRNNHTLKKRQNRYIRVSALLVFASVLTALIVLLAASDRAYGSDQEIEKLSRFMQASNPSDTAAQVFREGRDYIAKEEWKSAESSFAGFISSYPKDKNVDVALYYLAVALERQNRLTEAVKSLERLIRDYPQSNWVGDAKAKRVELASRLKDMKVINSGINEEDEEIRLAALQSLFDSRPERAVKLALEIIKPNSGSSSRMKEGAITLLADHGSREAIPVLIEIARNDPDPKLRWKAIMILGSIEDDRVIDFLNEVATKSSDRESALSAVRALGDHDSPRARAALLQIAQSNPDPELRMEAIRRLGDEGDDATVEELLMLFEVEKNTEIRRAIISALSNMDSPRARARIFEIARTSDDIEIRRKAIEAIGDREEDEKAVDALIQMYDSERDEMLKEDIIEALGDTNHKRALRKLMEIVKSSASANLKKRAISALADSDDPEASKFLEDLLKKND